MGRFESFGTLGTKLDEAAQFLADNEESSDDLVLGFLIAELRDLDRLQHDARKRLQAESLGGMELLYRTVEQIVQESHRSTEDYHGSTVGERGYYLLMDSPEGRVIRPFPTSQPLTERDLHRRIYDFERRAKPMDEQLRAAGNLLAWPCIHTVNGVLDLDRHQTFAAFRYKSASALVEKTIRIIFEKLNGQQSRPVRDVYAARIVTRPEHLESLRDAIQETVEDQTVEGYQIIEHTRDNKIPYSAGVGAIQRKEAEALKIHRAHEAAKNGLGHGVRKGRLVYDKWNIKLQDAPADWIEIQVTTPTGLSIDLHDHSVYERKRRRELQQDAAKFRRGKSMAYLGAAMMYMIATPQERGIYKELMKNPDPSFSWL